MFVRDHKIKHLETRDVFLLFFLIQKHVASNIFCDSRPETLKLKHTMQIKNAGFGQIKIVLVD